MNQNSRNLEASTEVKTLLCMWLTPNVQSQALYMVPQTPPGMTPEHRCRSKPWKPLGVAQDTSHLAKNKSKMRLGLKK